MKVLLVSNKAFFFFNLLTSIILLHVAAVNDSTTLLSTGAALLKAVTPESKIGNLGILLPAKDVSSSQAVMAEFIISFFLLFCVVAMIDKGRTDVQGSIPFIVGIIVSMNVIYAVSSSHGVDVKSTRANTSSTCLCVCE